MSEPAPTAAPPPPPARARSQQLLHRYFATTVALVTSYADAGGANVMACEWTMNVSWRPLRVMSLINHDDLTHELITASGEFGVNLCSSEQVTLSSFAGNVTGRECAKLDAPLFKGRTYRAKRIRAPMILGCVLNLECVVEQTVEIGAHTGFIGRAVAGRLDPAGTPLLYHQGRYFRLGELLTRPGELETDGQDGRFVNDDFAGSTPHRT